MKSNELRNSGKVIENVCKIEQIEPYYKRDVKLIRKTNEFGTVTYHVLNKKEEGVFVHRGSLESEMSILVDGLKVVEAAALQKHQLELWSALATIRQKAEERIDEIFRFVGQEVGEIEIYCVGENEFQNTIRYGQVVGAKIALTDEHIERPVSETKTTQS